MQLNNDEFETIVDTYQSKLKAFVGRITRCREDAEEVVQDTFFRAHRSLSAMSQEQRRALPLSPWLYTIARNAALNQLRKRRLSLPLSKLIDWETPESIVLKRLSLEEVETKLRRLPKALREAARLRFVEDRSLSQIASTCGEPLGTVKSHVHRAVVSMRRAIGRVA